MIIFNQNDNDCRCGLNLTMRSIAAGLKYDNMIPGFRDKDGAFQKGYYKCDEAVIEIVKERLIGNKQYRPFKTIAYSTYDVEDAFKAGFLTPYKMMATDDDIYEQISQKLKMSGISASKEDCRTCLIDLFSDVWKDQIDEQKKIKSNDKSYTSKTITNFLNSYVYSEKFASNGYFRSQFSSYLVSKFIDGISVKINPKYPILSDVIVDEETKLLINVLKHFSYIYIISSSRLKVVENRGYEIIKKMFDRLTEKDGYRLLPEDFQMIYFAAKKDEVKRRVICDFIAGMTDR